MKSGSTWVMDIFFLKKKPKISLLKVKKCVLNLNMIVSAPAQVELDPTLAGWPNKHVGKGYPSSHPEEKTSANNIGKPI